MSADLQRDLGRVEGKLDSLIAAVREDIAERKVRDGEFDKRLRRVENRQYYFMGGGAVIGAALGYVAQFVKGLVS